MCTYVGMCMCICVCMHIGLCICIYVCVCLGLRRFRYLRNSPCLVSWWRLVYLSLVCIHWPSFTPNLGRYWFLEVLSPLFSSFCSRPLCIYVFMYAFTFMCMYASTCNYIYRCMCLLSLYCYHRNSVGGYRYLTVV